MKPASQIAADALGATRWHQGAGECEAPSAISNPPRFRGKPSLRIAAAVKASKTTLIQLFGVGPIVAATIIGDVADIGRFPSRDRFAAYNGTAPIEVSSGERRRKVFRLSRRGNRRLNHAIHMPAVTQIRHRHSPGRADYDHKITQGHSGKEAIRGAQAAHQRRRLPAIARRHGPGRTTLSGPGRAHGERLCRQRGRLTPRTPALRPSHSRTRHHPTTSTPPDPPGTVHSDLEAPTNDHLTQRGLVRLHNRIAPPCRECLLCWT